MDFEPVNGLAQPEKGGIQKVGAKIMKHASALVALLDTGAYGATMSSTYNARPLAAEVLVDGARFAVVRDRQSFEALHAGQRVPEWLME